MPEPGIKLVDKTSTDMSVLFFGASMSRSVGERFFFKFVLKKVNVDYESLV